MARWRIKPQRTHFEGPAPGGADVSHGVNVYLVDADGNDRKIAVWYAARASGSGADVRPPDAVRPYLDDLEPPAHLVVTSTGVSVLNAD